MNLTGLKRDIRRAFSELMEGRVLTSSKRIIFNSNDGLLYLDDHAPAGTLANVRCSSSVNSKPTMSSAQSIPLKDLARLVSETFYTPLHDTITTHQVFSGIKRSRHYIDVVGVGDITRSSEGQPFNSRIRETKLVAEYFVPNQQKIVELR